MEKAIDMLKFISQKKRVSHTANGPNEKQIVNNSPKAAKGNHKQILVGESESSKRSHRNKTGVANQTSGQHGGNIKI